MCRMEMHCHRVCIKISIKDQDNENFISGNVNTMIRKKVNRCVPIKGVDRGRGALKSLHNRAPQETSPIYRER